LYGDAAVVNGITLLRGTYDGESFELDVQFTDTFVKRDGGWKLAASHASRIER
jgi:ketosteroid isomerase-like protein